MRKSVLYLSGPSVSSRLAAFSAGSTHHGPLGGCSGVRGMKEQRAEPKQQDAGAPQAQHDLRGSVASSSFQGANVPPLQKRAGGAGQVSPSALS